MNDTIEQELKDFLPLMKERQGETESLRRKLDGLDWKAVSASEQYYPVRFFADGLSAYVHVFDNASIYYTWASVEHALYVRLGASALKQSVRRSRDRNYPGEKKLVTLARQNRILSRDKERVAHRLRKLRNDYVHYINIMWDQYHREVGLQKLMSSQWPRIANEIRQVVPKDEQEKVLALLDFMKNETSRDDTYQRRKIPYIPGDPVNAEVLRFRTIRLNQFAKWIREPDDVRERLKRYKYGIERKDAMDCLQWSGDLLTYLKFLSR